MWEIERRREEERPARAGDPAEGAGGGVATAIECFNAVDDLISSTISSDSEAFNQQIEQENGQ